AITLPLASGERPNRYPPTAGSRNAILRALIALRLAGGDSLLSIRLTRLGAKKRPFYRIVVPERDAKRDGRFVEILGHYVPISQPAQVTIDRDRLDYWV